METLKNNWVLVSISTLVLLLLGVFAVRAMENRDTNEKPAQQDDVEWYYKGGPTDNILAATNWDTAGPAEDCGEPGDLPCSIPGPENPAAFQNHLNSLGESGVDSASPTKRPGTAR